MSWADPIDGNGRRIPAAGRSAATMAALPACREMRPAAPTRIIMATLMVALLIGLSLGANATAAFTTINAARLEVR